MGNGTVRLEQSVLAYREALQVRKRECVPLAWAQTQKNLGMTLWRLGARSERPQLLKEALESISSASAIYSDAGVSHCAVDCKQCMEALEAETTSIGKRSLSHTV
jgi:hypothetical protein